MFSRAAKLEKACSQNPDAPLFARLADLYLHRGMAHRALALCEQGCERFPDYSTGYVILSKCYEAQRELEAARIAIDKALRLDPENPGGFVHLSRIYQNLGIPTLALKSLQQAASLDPFSEDLSAQLDQLVSAIESPSPNAADDLKTGDESPVSDTALSAGIAPESIAPAAEIESPTSNIEETPIVAASERDNLPGEALVAVETASYEALPSSTVDTAENQLEQDEDKTPDQAAAQAEIEERAEGLPGPPDAEAAQGSLATEVGGTYDEPESAGEIDPLAADLFLDEAELGQGEEKDSLGTEIGGFSDDPDAANSDLDLFLEEEPEKPAIDQYFREDTDDGGVSPFDNPAAEEEGAPLPGLKSAESASPTGDKIPELILFDEEQVVEEPSAETDISELLIFDEEQSQQTERPEIDGVDLIAFGEPQPEDEAPTDTQSVDLLALDQEREKQTTAENNTVEIVEFDEFQTEGAENADVVELVASGEEATETPSARAPDTSEPLSPDEGLPPDEELPPDEGVSRATSQPESKPIEDLEQGEIAAESGPQNKPTQSGLGPQNDAELINLFQEIENEQTQETPTDLPSPGLELEDKDELIATETLAEIYSNQGLTQRAIETYRQILAQQPDNESIRNKLTYLEQHVEK